MGTVSAELLMSSEIRLWALCPAAFTAGNVFCKEAPGNTCRDAH